MDEAKIRALHDKLRACYDFDLYGTHLKVVRFAELLQSRYPDPHRCRFYHLLVGSTDRGNYCWEDFTEADSIERFIKEEYREMLTAQECGSPH